MPTKHCMLIPNAIQPVDASHPRFRDPCPWTEISFWDGQGGEMFTLALLPGFQRTGIFFAEIEGRKTSLSCKYILNFCLKVAKSEIFRPFVKKMESGFYLPINQNEPKSLLPCEFDPAVVIFHS